MEKCSLFLFWQVIVATTTRQLLLVDLIVAANNRHHVLNKEEEADLSMPHASTEVVELADAGPPEEMTAEEEEKVAVVEGEEQLPRERSTEHVAFALRRGTSRAIVQTNPFPQLTSPRSKDIEKTTADCTRC